MHSHAQLISMVTWPVWHAHVGMKSDWVHCAGAVRGVLRIQAGRVTSNSVSHCIPINRFVARFVHSVLADVAA